MWASPSGSSCAPEKADEAPKPEPKESDANDLFRAGRRRQTADAPRPAAGGAGLAVPQRPAGQQRAGHQGQPQELTGNLGTDADQARRQAEALAADPSQKIGPDGKAVQ